MKNTIIFLLMLWFPAAKAQMAVADAGTNGQLKNLNRQIIDLNSSLKRLNATAFETQKANETELALEKFRDEILYRVDSYLKKGQEINSILDKETQIVTQYKNLSSYLSQNATSSMRQNVMDSATGILKNTGSLVDMALSVLTDDIYRMDTEQRRSYLKEIDGNLSSLKSLMNDLIIRSESSVLLKKRLDEERKMREELFNDPKLKP
jgi:oligoendopeptidase F